MSLINIENLTFSYPSSYENVFENVSLKLDTDWRLGFIGRNGRGKTTLLRILCGELTEYSGRVTASAEFVRFPYKIEEGEQLAADVLRGLCPNSEDWQIVRELSYLDVEEDALWQQFSTLSKGQQTKMMLAALFLDEGKFPLIDEPTNHLDIKGRELAAAYLRRQKGFILVSHDRHFLDGCVDRILSINRSDIQLQSGNFSSFMENFQRQNEYEAAKSEHLKKDIKRLQKASRRTAAWSKEAEKEKTGALDKGFVSHKAAKVMKRSKIIEARRTDAIEQRSALLKNEETADRLKLFPLEYRAELLAELSDLEIVYGEKTVCRPVSFQLRRGDRIVLRGKNGCGKSSILKLMAGESIGHSGEIKVGSGLIVSCVSQDTSHLSGSLSDYAEDRRIDESLFKAILRKMDFERSQFEKDMQGFSGGQKKKVLIAASLCEQAHLYIWDEPLNFIDIWSRVQIEQLLKEFSPTMIFAEHDLAFCENIANKTVEI